MNLNTMTPIIVETQRVVNLINRVKAEATDRVIPFLTNNPNMLISVIPTPPGKKDIAPTIVAVYVNKVESIKL